MTNAERFEKYITDFAEQNGIDKTEALDNAIVKEYKKWLEEESSEVRDDNRSKEAILETIQESCTEDKCVGRGTSQH